MDARAVLLEAPERLALQSVALRSVTAGDIVVETAWSGVSTGTEKLLWTGRMPAFPGMGYPLVPGYESVGRVVDAGGEAKHRIGDWVFVPGANCYESARGLFGATADRLVVPAARALSIPEVLAERGALLSLAATAWHALVAGPLPELIVGHGVLGRLAARLVIALGGVAPTVWEIDPTRREDGEGYSVVDPVMDQRRDYPAILDVSGDPAILDLLIARLAKGGEIALAGFYERPMNFAFPPAFMKEARMRVAAEFTPTDLAAVAEYAADGRLGLDGLISHVRPAAAASEAYPAAFAGGDCLKMVLAWERPQ